MTRTPPNSPAENGRPSSAQDRPQPGKGPIKVYKAGQNAKGDNRLTAAATPR